MYLHVCVFSKSLEGHVYTQLSIEAVLIRFFHHCGKIPKINKLKGEKVCLVHHFSGFSSWLIGLVDFGLWQHRASCGKPMMDQSCLSHGGWEAKGEMEAGNVQGPNVPFRVMPQYLTSFHKAHLLKVPPFPSSATG
jgi:hypothetical protein